MKKSSAFAGIPFGILFIAFAVGVVLVMNVIAPDDGITYAYTDAVVTKVERYSDSGRRYAVVEYTVDGKKYSDTLNKFESTMTEGSTVKIMYDVKKASEAKVAEADERMPWFIAAGVFAAIGLFIAIGPAVSAVKSKGRPRKTKLYITDYEKATGISIIPFGALMVLSSFFVMLSGHFMWIPIMLIGVGCVGFGIYKLISFSKKKDEFDDFKRIGKKLTGKIVTIQQATNINRKNKNSTPIIAVCLVADPDTGEEKRYYSRKVISGGGVSLSGMLVNIYTYPSGQYYVDLESARLEAEEGGRKVHDFR